jgi:Xaa-Pro aminopeptidase
VLRGIVNYAPSGHQTMHEGALQRLRIRAREAGLDGLLLFGPANLQYLAGFHSNAYSRPLTLLVPLASDPVLLVPRLEELQARRLTGLRDVRSYVEWDAGSVAGGAVEEEWRALLLDALADRGLPGGRLGVERAALSAPREEGLRAALPKHECVDASGWVEALRLVKSQDEVANHRRAGALAAAGLDAAVAAARAGATELEIKGGGLQAILAEAGRRHPDLPVAAGGNALAGERIAAVHTPASAVRPAPGDLLFVVWSVAVGGSHCELSRTVVAGGDPTAEQRRLFRAVAAAHAAARDAARPGTAAADLDRAARTALAGAGLADHLPMRAGHGVGFAPVEAPNLGAGDRTPLRPGMVISIEPGVCIPGTGGVLWADNYVVTEAGVDRLTSYPVLAEEA